MSYIPTWNNPYLPQNTTPIGQSFNQQYYMPTQYQQSMNGIIKVNGRDSALQYQLNGNIAVPTGGTAAAIAVALALDGEALQNSRAIVTPAAVEQYFNVTCAADITVPKGCCYTLAVENVNAGVGDAIVDEQTISIADGNLVISRIA